jgi:hypothetical protein
VQNQVGASNADNPVFTPVLYDPSIPTNSGNPGARFSSSGLPTSSIARMYHSLTTLTPKGEIWIAGSNPNLDVSTKKYATEYRVEILSPPYVGLQRPVITNSPYAMGYGVTYQIELQTAPSLTATIEG